MTNLLLIWLGVCVALMAVGMGRAQSAGLPLAYFLGLSFIHTPGALVYLNSGEWETSATVTQLGFQQTVVGMVAFAIGVAMSRNIFVAPPAEKSPLQPPDLVALDKLALLYFCCGLFSFMAMQFLGRIPTLGAMIAALGSLMIIGACLRMWIAAKVGDSGKWWRTAAFLPLFPLVTLLKDGFLGFGTYWMLAVICFSTNQSERHRVGYYLLAPIVAFLGLSFFVNYMASRSEFRQLVWVQQVGIGDRIQRVVEIFENFELLDLSDRKHVAAIDGRLNQNILVGLAVERLDSGKVPFANGTTIIESVEGLIPRAIWPDKPAVGGGGSVVTQFTGVKFAEGTSVGAGQVLEFYANKGIWGVIGGFLLYGWIIGKIDLRVINNLNGGNQKGFVVWFMMGLAMLQPGGNLLEIVVTVASSAIAGSIMGYYFNRHSERRRAHATEFGLSTQREW